ncbi:hypothetical protein HY745_13550 [Candidatus Desantisbacteria bacterium]|nr:hypothetical protein [Candidatus Desantisbacteria bacterium]
MNNIDIKKIIAPCLWSASLEDIDINLDKFLIIERILEHGGDKQISFLFNIYIKEDIIQVIKESSYLNAKTVNYWCCFFDIKKGDTRCYTKPSLHLWPAS